MLPDAYALRRFVAADLPMMAVWLETPAIREWWGDPVDELAFVTGDLGNLLVDQQIGALGQRPFAYLQSSPCAVWGAPQFAAFPDEARAVDICVGVPDLIGRGHGAAILRLYARSLIAQGAPSVVIDPAPDNERAVRAYRRAGFRDCATLPGKDGDPVLVMEFDPV